MTNIPSSALHRHVLIGMALGAALGTLVLGLIAQQKRKRDNGARRFSGVVENVTELIGNTPLLRINSLSDLTGCEILGKCEFLNPGGSVKDRIALQIIRQAEQAKKITPHTNPRSRIFEGTSGSTGISLAFVARALGYEAEIFLPDDTATEKSELIHKMGATVTKVRPVSISNRLHYVNVARDRASVQQKEGKQSLFVDQFENQANWLTHYHTTGPEIWKQTRGKIDAFISGAGTGGTIAGVGNFLKSHNSKIKLVLADPPGSGLFNKVKQGVMFSETEIEGKRRRHQMDTVVEGIGSNRLTDNIASIIYAIDDAISVTDEEAIKMSRFILEREGLFIGSSSAVNLVAAYKFAKCSKFNGQSGSHTQLKSIVTILCDSGQRHLSKFWSDVYLRENGFLSSFDEAKPMNLDF
ncbi:hypothetical protein O181_026773 [Austropuccinia psidii MF-1]|uniref:cysteine synthase n=1 Tax=Austropuccinia psidii MF-1 TaxID=1389203 RepID=A0A9Q3H0B0_9BASI|nr:hypothetical protein [Austropuccinia psidii MF-1]